MAATWVKRVRSVLCSTVSASSTIRWTRRQRRVFEAALEAGAEDVISGDGGHDVYCAPDDFSMVRDALEEALGDPEAAHLIGVLKILLRWHRAGRASKMIDALDDNDDVQRCC